MANPDPPRKRKNDYALKELLECVACCLEYVTRTWRARGGVEEDAWGIGSIGDARCRARPAGAWLLLFPARSFQGLCGHNFAPAWLRHHREPFRVTAGRGAYVTGS